MSKAEFVQKMFDKLSQDYDFMNDLISFGLHKLIKKNAINNVPIKAGFKILDVCTGTGDIPLLITEKFGDSVDIIGVDFSGKMLEIALKRAIKHDNIKFITADALNLPFEDKTFDAVFISFGLRNLADLKKGIIELKRVTKDNGYVINLDMGKPKGVLGHILRFYMFKLVTFIGKLIHGNSTPYKYLFESAQAFPSQDELVRIFSDFGFKNVKNYDFAFGAIAEQISIN